MARAVKENPAMYCRRKVSTIPPSDKYMPFMDADAAGALASNLERFTFGPLLRYFRHRNIDKKYDVEPEWRKPGNTLTTGYQPRNYA
jgi:hypothetical protein